MNDRLLEDFRIMIYLASFGAQSNEWKSKESIRAEMLDMMWICDGPVLLFLSFDGGRKWNKKQSLNEW